MNRSLALLTCWLLTVPARLRDGGRDRGDIPGWVMIAIMSAALIVLLIPFVGPKLEDVFQSAVDNVTSNSGGTGG